MKKVILQDGSTVEINEPKAGNLRGLKMSDIALGDYASVCELLKRTAGMTEQQLDNLPMTDIFKLQEKIVEFVAGVGKPTTESNSTTSNSANDFAGNPAKSTK